MCLFFQTEQPWLVALELPNRLSALPEIEAAASALPKHRGRQTHLLKLRLPNGCGPSRKRKQKKNKNGPLNGFANIRISLLLYAMITLSAAAGYIGAHGLPASWFHHETAAARVNRSFWRLLFEDKRDTFIVPADGGLVMLQSFIKQHVSLEDYANGSYRKESQMLRES